MAKINYAYEKRQKEIAKKKKKEAKLLQKAGIGASTPEDVPATSGQEDKPTSTDEV